MFADYRVPQILNTLGCLWYSPLLDHAVRQKRVIESGHTWEIQMRGELSSVFIDLLTTQRGE